MARHGHLAAAGLPVLLALVSTLVIQTPSSTKLNAVSAADPSSEVIVTTYVAPTPTDVGPQPSTDEGRAPLNSTPVPRPPVITIFACEPCVVEPGSGTVLSWDLEGATAAYLDGRGVTAPGSTVVHPDQTTTYRLVATNEAGQSEKTVTVEVQGLPTIHYFTCLPCEVSRGEQSTLSWDLSGATAAYLDGLGVTAPGNTVVAPPQTTTYRLVVVNERGSVERLVTVTVKEGGDPETVSEALRRADYEVRWVGYLPLSSGGETVSAVLAPVARSYQSQDVADQYYAGFKALHDTYPGQTLTVGLYDDVRYILFVTVESVRLEAYLRGEMDGQVFWRIASWNVWDEWIGRWLQFEPSSFTQKDFASKSFGF